ncbi:unnamed protein product [Caretta caretta]
MSRCFRGAAINDAPVFSLRYLSCDYRPTAWVHTGSQGIVRYMQETSFCLSVGNLLSYSMSDSNSTDFNNPSTFILLGIPGLEAAHVWISIPFYAMYAIAILENFTILFIAKREPSLHGPMYYFLCMLAITDLVLSTSILPKMLSIFWFISREINFSACLTQMYFILRFSVIQSGILVAMAFDRSVTICDPLRHSTTLTNPVVVQNWPGCGAAWCHAHTALSLPAFYIPHLFAALTERFGHNVALNLHVLMANMYLLVPPMLNPIIYGVKTQEIQSRLLQLFTQKGT